MSGSGAGGSLNNAFASGETRTFNGSWDQTDLQGQPVTTGQYSVKMWFYADTIDGVNFSLAERESQLAAAPITITIR